MNNVYLSIGSNIAPTHNFRQCAATLEKLFTHPSWSPIYQCPPVGMQGADFLNAAVHVQTDLTIPALLQLLNELEISQGRTKAHAGFADRPLDADLLLYNDQCCNTNTLTLPRPELTNMSFVLVPMVDLAPDLVHPLEQKTLATLLQALQTENPAQVASMKKLDITL